MASVPPQHSLDIILLKHSTNIKVIPRFTFRVELLEVYSHFRALPMMVAIFTTSQSASRVKEIHRTVLTSGTSRLRSIQFKFNRKPITMDPVLVQDFGSTTEVEVMGASIGVLLAVQTFLQHSSASQHLLQSRVVQYGSHFRRILNFI